MAGKMASHSFNSTNCQPLHQIKQGSAAACKPQWNQNFNWKSKPEPNMTIPLFRSQICLKFETAEP